jgi:hypothetical protein
VAPPTPQLLALPLLVLVVLLVRLLQVPQKLPLAPHAAAHVTLQHSGARLGGRGRAEAARPRAHVLEQEEPQVGGL